MTVTEITMEQAQEYLREYYPTYAISFDYIPDCGCGKNHHITLTREVVKPHVIVGDMPSELTEAIKQMATGHEYLQGRGDSFLEAYNEVLDNLKKAGDMFL